MFYADDRSPLVTRTEALKTLIGLLGEQWLGGRVNVKSWTNAWILEGSLIYLQHLLIDKARDWPNYLLLTPYFIIRSFRLFAYIFYVEGFFFWFSSLLFSFFFPFFRQEEKKSLPPGDNFTRHKFQIDPSLGFAHSFVSDVETKAMESDGYDSSRSLRVKINPLRIKLLSMARNMRGKKI